ncbi:MAG: hypothetical protein QOE30_1959 [Mycobacterium sp.]|uniref:hypothetical protein n=1 Tax=Mycobacterium sp. TaxID=1785 RepID=UPI0028B621DD|nr:hypothetical protein [Mycobacterium sp.]MDT5116220.1 hypothetical protein [Mycobacterium sp.]
MKKVMASLSVVLAVVLGAAFVSVGLGVPAHADCEWTFPGSVMWQKCMSDPGVHIADASNLPPCQQPGGAMGESKACSSCLYAFGAGAPSPTVSFDCGSPGAPNPSSTNERPHCMVGEIHTNQPGCFGNLQADGTVIATN